MVGLYFDKECIFAVISFLFLSASNRTSTTTTITTVYYYYYYYYYHYYYPSGIQAGVRGPKGVRGAFPGGPREDSPKLSLFAWFLTIYDSYVFKFEHVSPSLI